MYLEEYNVLRSPRSGFCVYDTRGLDQDQMDEGLEEISTWMFDGVRHNQPCYRVGDEKIKGLGAMSGSMRMNNSSRYIKRKVNCVIVVADLSQIHKDLKCDDLKSMEALRDLFHSPAVKNSNESPILILTHGDSLNANDRINTRLKICEYLGIPETSLSKAEKVLVVERVIESLGLQPVRDSLVGTVEKRGISGGQRKRVNVGLELVMEPSLLFLDEPTSGLDSSSSQLLLRALRREALEGVNICMVVHQPSYSLFNMFDDLILLAKGGCTVYHGSVRHVEDYFAHLGIHVPERINPPDYFIDVLEGMVKISTSSGMNCEALPLRWMLHKGYPLPSYMRNSIYELGLPVIQANSRDQEYNTGIGTEQLSFCGEYWQNLQYKLEGSCDVMQNNFLKSKDLSRRRTPTILL